MFHLKLTPLMMINPSVKYKAIKLLEDSMWDNPCNKRFGEK